MKVILLICCCLEGSFAKLYGQKISIRGEDIPLRSVFEMIEEMSEYRIVYNQTKLDVDRKVTLDEQEAEPVAVVEKLLKGSSHGCKVEKNYIIIAELRQIPVEKKSLPKWIDGILADDAGQKVVGAYIIVDHRKTGTISDSEGHFRLRVEEGDFLKITHIGYNQQLIRVGKQNSYFVQLTEKARFIDEVVVTALGIKKMKRNLSYSIEQLNMEQLGSVRSLNVGDDLSGKVAGLSVLSSTGALGIASDPRIVLRGNRTIDGNNQAMIVVDGVLFATSASGLSMLNVDDIERINILKGASAAALYGSNANNGVIEITTRKGEANRRQVNFSSFLTFDLPYGYPSFQNKYGQGMGGLYLPNSDRYSWGPEMKGQKVRDWTGNERPLLPQPNNYRDLFSVGYNAIHSIAISTGSNVSTTYFSYNNTLSKGVLENNKLLQHHLNLRFTYDVLPNLKTDFRASYFNRRLYNAPLGGDDLFNPMHELMLMPRSIRTEDIRHYFYLSDSGAKKQTTWAPGSTGIVNPYWSMYAREAPATHSNFNFWGTVRYEPTKNYYVQLRTNANTTDVNSEVKLWWDTQYINQGKGDYQKSFSHTRQWSADLLIGLDHELGNGFKLTANAGAEIKDYFLTSMESYAGGLKTENKFALNYAIALTAQDSEVRIQKQSLYATAQLGYKERLFLDATVRNDWSSTLPPPHSYLYPSIGASAVISELLRLPPFISWAKLRLSYAEVGNDARFARIFQTYTSVATGPVGSVDIAGINKVPDHLQPEKTRSWEAGLDLRFLANRLMFDLTWYRSNSINQLINIISPPSSGYARNQINCGDIENTGIEWTISATPIAGKEFRWNLSAGIARNRNTVKSLTESITRYDLDSPVLALGTPRAVVGRAFGELYSRGIIRDDRGRIMVDELGLPRMQVEANHYLGNMSYDWTSGLTNSFGYKNWHFSFLIDLKVGGMRQSATEATMLAYGTSVESLYGREGFILPGVKTDGSPNDIVITAQQYGQYLGGRVNNAAAELFNHSATNARLREASLGYEFRWENRFVKSLSLALTGKNLFFIYNGCGWFDPDVTGSVGTNAQGSENSFLPLQRSVGLTLKLRL